MRDVTPFPDPKRMRVIDRRRAVVGRRSIILLLKNVAGGQLRHHQLNAFRQDIELMEAAIEQ